MIIEFKLAFTCDYSELNVNLSTFEATLIGGNKTAFNKFKESLVKNSTKIISPAIFKYISTIGEIVFFNQTINLQSILIEIGKDIKKSTKKLDWSFIELKYWIQQDKSISSDKKKIINNLTDQVETLVIDFNLKINQD